MFIKFNISTCRVGCEETSVYRFNDDDYDEDYIREYGEEIAREVVESYGIFSEEMKACEESGVEFEESDCFSVDFEILDMTEEEIIEEYGEILEA